MKMILMSALAAVVGAGALADDARPMSWPVERKKVVSFGWEWGPITPADLRRYAPHPGPGKECGFDRVFLGRIPNSP